MAAGPHMECDDLVFFILLIKKIFVWSLIVNKTVPVRHDGRKFHHG